MEDILNRMYDHTHTSIKWDEILDSRLYSKRLFTPASPFEHAWHFCDVMQVIDCLQEQNIFLGGGDVLNKGLRHTYDNWAYNGLLTENLETNSRLSCEVARRYISHDHSLRADNCYILVIHLPKQV